VKVIYCGDVFRDRGLFFYHSRSLYDKEGTCMTSHAHVRYVIDIVAAELFEVY
jgi:hypothetical protein